MVCDTRESTTCLDYSSQKKRCCLKLGVRGTAAGAIHRKQRGRGREAGTGTYSQSCGG